MAAGPREKQLFIEQNMSSRALFAWLESLEKEIYKNKTMAIEIENETFTGDRNFSLYFLLDNKNYVVSQGLTYCARFIETPII